MNKNTMKTTLSMILLSAILLTACESPNPTASPELGQQIYFSVKDGTFTHLMIEGTDPNGQWNTSQESSNTGLSQVITKEYWKGTVVLVFEVVNVGRRSCVIDYLHEASGSKMAIITYTEGVGCTGEGGSARQLGSEQALFEYVDPSDGLKLLDLSANTLDSVECIKGIVEAFAAHLTYSVVLACGGVALSSINETLLKYHLQVTDKPIPTATHAATLTPSPIPTITSQPISSPYGTLCGQYMIITYGDPSGSASNDYFFFTSDNKALGLSDSFDKYGGYYRVYNAVIDWTPSTSGHGTPVDGWITSWSGLDMIDSLQSCSQTQNQPPTQALTNAQAQISNEVYFAALRQSPGYSNKNNDTDLLANVPAGDIIQILGGPEQADGLNWWNVSWNGIAGWMADHTGSGKTIMIFLP